MQQNKVPELLRTELQLPNSLIVVSDIHLANKPTAASIIAQDKLCEQIKLLINKPNATIVLNGDIIELWAGKEPSVEQSLNSHPKLCKLLKEFSSKNNHQLFYVVGNHDGKLAWSKTEQDVIKKYIGANICLSLEISFDTSKGKKSILFEHGHQLDPDNAFADQYDPHDKPFGQHIVQNALPIVSQTQGKLFEGINHLSEPHKFAKFLASRIVYREIFSRLWWLFVPLAALLVLRIFVEYSFFVSSGASIGKITQLVLFTELAVLINALVLLAGGFFITQRLLSRAKIIPGVEGEVNHNKPAIEKARKLILANKNLGYITGHTHRPQVLAINNGFYANSGCGTEMVEACSARLGLPKTYISRNHMHWLDIEINKNSLDIAHWQMIGRVKNQSRLEAMATKRKHFEYPLAKQKHLTISFL